MSGITADDRQYLRDYSQAASKFPIEAILRHPQTGAVIVLVERDRLDDWKTVQLNRAAGHGPGWVSYLDDTDAERWEQIGEGELLMLPSDAGAPDPEPASGISQLPPHHEGPPAPVEPAPHTTVPPVGDVGSAPAAPRSGCLRRLKFGNLYCGAITFDGGIILCDACRTAPAPAQEPTP